MRNNQHVHIEVVSYESPFGDGFVQTDTHTTHNIQTLELCVGVGWIINAAIFGKGREGREGRTPMHASSSVAASQRSSRRGVEDDMKNNLRETSTSMNILGSS